MLNKIMVRNMIQRKSPLIFLFIFLTLIPLSFSETPPFTITEKTDYDLVENTVYLTITENLGKDQNINISNIFTDDPLTRQINYTTILLKQDYMADIYGRYNESQGKVKIINETCNSKNATDCTIDYYGDKEKELFCDYVLADKSCVKTQYGIIGQEEKSDYLPIPDLKQKTIISGKKIEQKQEGIPLPKNSVIYLKYKYKHPIAYQLTVPSEINKYDIRVTSADGIYVSELDPTWWDSSWDTRRKLTFTNTDWSSANFENLTVLVILSGGSNIDYAKTQNAGEDLRFVDSDDTTSLSYEIVRWNETGDSIVYVEVPQVDNDNEDFIYMYYDNSGADDGQDVDGTWSDWNLVAHMEEADPLDSTANSYNGSETGGVTVENSKVGYGLHLASDYITFPDGSFPPTGDFTFMLWFNMDVNNIYQAFVVDYVDAAGGWLYFIVQNADRNDFYIEQKGSGASTSGVDAAAETWYFITWVYDGGQRLYINDKEEATDAAADRADIDAWDLGRRAYYADMLWDGFFDEVKITNQSLSLDKINATYQSEMDNFITFGDEEEEEAPPAIIITFVSQTPADLEENSTGELIIKFNATGTAINVSSCLLSRTLYDSIEEEYHWSLRVPNNTKATTIAAHSEYGNIWRADNRNGTGWWENNFTDIFTLAVTDEDELRMNFTNNSARTEVNLTYNGTVEDSAFRNIWYLDRTDQEGEDKTDKGYSIYRDNPILIKRWSVEGMHSYEDYTVCNFINFNYTGNPNKDLIVRFCNSSFDIDAEIRPRDSPNCVYVSSYDKNEVVDYVYSQRNSTYVRACFGVANGTFAGVNTTPLYYVSFESMVSQPNAYIIKYMNGSTSTDIRFNDTNTSWNSENNGKNWAQTNFTPDYWSSSAHSGDQFIYNLKCWNDTGGSATSSNQTDNIGLVKYDPLKPSVDWLYSITGGYDYDLNETHSGNLTIRVLISTDPDSEYIPVNHNLTLRNPDGTWNYTINSSFNSSTGYDLNVSFDTLLVDNGSYRLNVTATDDEGETASYLSYENFTIDNDFNLTIIDPTTANPKSVSENDNIPIHFNFTVNNDPITENVNVLNITAGTEECAIPTGADPTWYNSSWIKRINLTFSNIAWSTTNLSNFTVLVLLNSSRINYSLTKDNGEDIRFIDSDGELLFHEIERWNETGDSFVWVKVDYIENSESDLIQLYYNASVDDGQNVTGTWSGNWSGVWHLNETDPPDSTANSYNGSETGGVVLEESKIGYGLHFASDYITFPDGSFLNESNFTFMVWFNMDDNTLYQCIIADAVQAWTSFQTDNADKDDFLIQHITSYASSTPNLNAQIGTWYFAAWVYDSITNKGYFNGTEKISYTADGRANTGTWDLGWRPSSSDMYWDGLFDELKIIGRAFSADEVNATYNSESDNFITFGDEEGEPGVEQTAWYNSSSELWIINCTAPSLTGFQDLYLEANYTTYSVVRNNTQTSALRYSGASFSRNPYGEIGLTISSIRQSIVSRINIISILLKEVVSRMFDSVRSLSNSFNLVISLIREGTFTRPNTISITMSSVLSRIQTFFRTTSVSTYIISSLGKTITFLKLITQNIDFVISTIKEGIFSRLNSMLMTITELTSKIISFPRSVVDLITTTFKLSRTFNGVREASQSMVFGISLTREQILSRLGSVPISIIDSLTKTITFLRIIPQNIILSISTIREGIFSRLNSISITLIDTLSKIMTFPRIIADSITTIFKLDRIFEGIREISQPITFISSLIREQLLSRLNILSINITESLSKTITFLRTIPQSITLTFSLIRGQILSRLATLSISITDALSRIITFPRTLSETVSLSISLIKEQILSRLNVLSVNLIGVVSRTFEGVRLIPESISTTISLIREQILGRLTSVSISIINVLSKILTGLTRLITETFNLTISLIKEQLLSRLNPFSISIIDSLTKIITFLRIIPQSITNTISLIRDGIFSRLNSISIILLDSISKIFSRTIINTLSISLIETSTKIQDLTRLIPQSLSFLIGIIRETVYLRLNLIPISLIESLSKTITFLRTIPQSINLTISTIREQLLSRLNMLSISITEAISKIVSYPRILISIINLTESLSKIQTYLKTLTNTINSTISLIRAQILSRLNLFSISIITASLRDQILSRLVTLSIIITDTLSKILSLPTILSESFNLTISLVRVQTLSRLTSFSANLLDVVSKIFSRGVVNSLLVSITDSLSRAFDGARGISQSILLSISSIREQTFSRLTTLSMTITELISRVSSGARIITQPINILISLIRGQTLSRLSTVSISLITSLTRAFTSILLEWVVYPIIAFISTLYEPLYELVLSVTAGASPLSNLTVYLTSTPAPGVTFPFSEFPQVQNIATLGAGESTNITWVVLMPSTPGELNITGTVQSNHTMCYQESPNVSTVCGGLDTGNAYDTGNWTNPENLFDENWGTYSTRNESDDGFSFAYANYTKPDGAQDTSLWRIKLGNEAVNNENIAVCWDGNPSKLIFRMASERRGAFYFSYFWCWDGDSWRLQDVDNSVATFGGYVYEEGMNWNISDGFSPVSTTEEIEVITKSYLIAYITTGQNLVTTQNSSINITVYRQALDNATDLALFDTANISANITNPAGALDSVNFTNLGSGEYSLNYSFDYIGTYNVVIRAEADYYGYVEAETHIYVGRFPIYATIISSTEYMIGEEGEISLRVVDADNNQITGGYANVSIFYPNKTLFVNESNMTELMWGIYYYNFTVPSPTGIYITFANFTLGVNSDQDSKTFHVAPWTSTITEINLTTHQIYDLLQGNITTTLNDILNLTNETYILTLDEITDLSDRITTLQSDLTSLTDYLETRWGSEKAKRIMNGIDDIERNLEFLKLSWSGLSFAEINSILFNIRKDSTSVLSILAGEEEETKKLLYYIPPIIIAIIAGIVIWYVFMKRRKRQEEESIEYEE